MCLSLLWKSKKDYFANLNKKNITDNKRFWKTLLIQKKYIYPERMNLTEEESNSLLTNCEEVAKELKCKCCKKYQYPKLLEFWLFDRKHWWSYSKG